MGNFGIRIQRARFAQDLSVSGFRCSVTWAQTRTGGRLVVAPYATALALLVSPAESIKNLKRLEKSGMYGRMGFYESLDYTRQTGTAEAAKESSFTRTWLITRE